MTRSAGSGYAFVAIAASGWGTWPLIMRHAPMDPALQSVVLMAVTAACTLPLLARDRVPVRARPVHWLGMIWLAAGDAFNCVLFFGAYQRTSVAIAVLTHYLTPVFIALAAPFVLGEKLRRKTLLAIGVSLTGLVFLLEPWREGISRADVVGAAFGAGSAVFYASNVLTNKRLIPVFSGSEMMCLHCAIAVPILWFFVPSGALAATPALSLGVVAAGALGPGVLSGMLFTWGLRRIPASHASVLTLLEPFVAVVLAALFLGQRLGSLTVLGGGLILGGAVAVVTQRRVDGLAPGLGKVTERAVSEME